MTGVTPARAFAQVGGGAPGEGRKAGEGCIPAAWEGRRAAPDAPAAGHGGARGRGTGPAGGGRGYAPGQGPGVGVSCFSSVSVLKTLNPRRW